MWGGCSPPEPTSAGTTASEERPRREGVVYLPEASRPFVTVEPISRQSAGAVLKVPGRVAFRDGALSRLGTPLPGRVLEVHVATGDRVKAGDPLVTLDCPDAAAARSAVATAQTALREAKAARAREERMLAGGVGVERDLLAAEARLADAEAELARAQAASTFVGEGKGSRVVLRAPMAGAVISRRATVGASVQPGEEALVEVGDPAALWVIAEVFERDLPLVKEGVKATMELPSLRAAVHGKVVSVGAVVVSELRTAPVRIALEGIDQGLLRPGMFGRVRIESPEAGLSLPTEAVLIKDGKQSVVYVEQEPLTFVRRPVQVAQPIEGRVQVISGVSPGERVVVRGALLLDGAAEQLL